MVKFTFKNLKLTKIEYLIGNTGTLQLYFDDQLWYYTVLGKIVKNKPITGNASIQDATRQS